ncbi:NAD-dependent epimerase/dehydratase family protein [Algoriphagus aestuariicola]|jgi:nucleoside-diphosphate-sugar epimerase|uniref:NAD-dependent epimerase/dehydratase family protein n=1 Tax=Algoriphagus aestuariicola TaxID=1852016 RepID=A0ABS3BQH1_9BACT|nr:NAD-dependent epimerase/dehydratase family protein [Algoriphagus aestuariicola]MBN7799919.1 NAD-dependent epimerase/dehydratase family protein [Algoriphagus aestuariicola]
MKYLLTGAYGFLGRHILGSLQGADVITLGRRPENDIACSLGESVPSLPVVDVVIHCAGKAHVVPKTAEEGEEFYKVNTEGTKNLLKALDALSERPKQFILISTVSVYGLDSGQLISETHPLLGTSPYAKSKILAEKAVLAWAAENMVPIVVLRLPLLIGSNPPGNLDKMINGIKNGRYASINGGRARKSMVLAVDVANLIPNLIGRTGIYNLTDRCHPSFNELERKISDILKTKIHFKLPLKLVSILAVIGDKFSFFPVNSALIDKMTLDLTFDDSKAADELKWAPNKVLNADFL